MIESLSSQDAPCERQAGRRLPIRVAGVRQGGGPDALTDVQTCRRLSYESSQLQEGSHRDANHRPGPDKLPGGPSRLALSLLNDRTGA